MVWFVCECSRALTNILVAISILVLTVALITSIGVRLRLPICRIAVVTLSVLLK